MNTYRILKKDNNFLIDNGCRLAETIDVIKLDFPLPWYVELQSSVPGDLSTKDIIDNVIVEATADVITARNNKRLDDLAKVARDQRDKLLIETDNLMYIDYPQTDEKRNEFVVYRKALRDLPTSVGFPENINWPVKPNL